MIRSRLGLRAFGVCLALAGLMVVGVASAQAEVGAKWLVEGKAVTNELKVELSGTLENNTGTLLGVIGTKPIHITCTGVTFGGTNTLLVEGKLTGKVKFTTCTIATLKEGKVEQLAACTPPGGVIESVEGKGLLGLHSGSTVTVLEPSSGAVFTTINTGEECAFGEKITISGKLAVVDAAAGTSSVTHLITEFGALTELYINGNKANKATIDGSGVISLAGKHVNLKWAADPA